VRIKIREFVHNKQIHIFSYALVGFIVITNRQNMVMIFLKNDD